MSLGSVLGLSITMPVSLGSVLWYVTTALEIVVIVIAIRKRIPRLLPIFLAYLIWTVASDAVGYAVKNNPVLYEGFFRWEMPLDSLVQFGVLVELGWSVLRPMRSVLPRLTILFISLAILAAGAAVWPLTIYTVNHSWWATVDLPAADSADFFDFENPLLSWADGFKSVFGNQLARQGTSGRNGIGLLFGDQHGRGAAAHPSQFDRPIRRYRGLRRPQLCLFAALLGIQLCAEGSAAAGV